MSIPGEQLSDLSWSLYWSQDQLHSCISDNSETGQQTLNALWQEFAMQLPASANVLDLATGNGAVPVALLGSGLALNIDAVDAADIDPKRFLSRFNEIGKVNFHANVDILKLPFQTATYDAITSQFGIEYAGLEEATKGVTDLLVQGGRIGFLIHQVDSEILKSSSRKLGELSALLAPKGLIETLSLVIKGEADFVALEEVGKQYLQSESLKTEAISGQVFSGINQVSQLLQSDRAGAVRLAATLDLRLRAEQERLQQLASAAQSESQLSAYIDKLGDWSLANAQSKEIHADGALIGCFVTAQKQ